VTINQNFFSPLLYSLLIILAITGMYSTSVSANTSPDAVDDVMTLVRGQTTMMLEGDISSVLENDTDIDGDNLSVDSVTSEPVNGALTLNPDGSFTYDHDNSDSLSDYFVYRVCDDGEPVECTDATVNIFIFPSDDAICSIPGVGIPEDGVVTDTIELAANGGVVDMNLALLIEHTWVGDLSATLSHDGVSVLMLDQPGVPAEDEYGCGERNIDVILDDEAEFPAEDMCVTDDDPVIFGSASPSGRLSDFRAQDVAGTWSLDVGDVYVDDSGGILQMWCLIPVDEAICSIPNEAIPDDDDLTGVTDSIEVMLAGNLTDVNVMVQINHTWVGDISAVLSHNSIDVMLLDRPGVPGIDDFGCDGVNIDAVFDDSEASAAEDTCSVADPAISGFFSPSEPLGSFNDQELSGSWSLQVTDAAIGDTGNLQAWCLVPVVNSGTFTVSKDFSDDNADSVSIALSCTSGTVTNSPQIVDAADCQNGDPRGGSCTIVNTLVEGTFTVNKDFSDDSADSVSITLSCTSGTVVNNPQSASEFSPAVFGIENFTEGTTCTATEGASPAGYVADEADCQDDDAINGSCTIVNTLVEGTFTVNKDFSDDSTDSVSIALSCTSGTVTNNPQSASEAAAAVFAIEGFSADTTCTATEGASPAGYVADETDCQDDDAINGSCTIVNRPVERPEVIFSDGFEDR